MTISTNPIVWLARAGYAARGIVYISIGWLAMLAVFAGSYHELDSKGAMQAILSQPFGKGLLAVVATGLGGYVVWRAVQAILDTDDHGWSVRGSVIRAGLLMSAITHSLLAYFAVTLIFSLGQNENNGGAQDWTALLLRQTYGQWLVAIVGGVIIGIGVAHIWKGWHANFEKYLEWSEDKQKIGTHVCRIGLIARGIAFLIIGGFFLSAAWTANAHEARGLAGALRALQAQPYGWALLGTMACGLMAFGTYSLIEAVYRRVEPTN